MTISNFHNKTTKNISITITYDGDNPNITGDTVTLYLVSKDKVPINSLTKNADVTTYGATGIAVFELTTTDTAILPGDYKYIIQWVSSSVTKILESGDVTILDNFLG